MIYSYGPLHMDEQRQDDQLEPIYKFCADTGYTLEDLLGAMDDRDGWWERVREICAGRWWWWWHMYCTPGEGQGINWSKYCDNKKSNGINSLERLGIIMSNIKITECNLVKIFSFINQQVFAHKLKKNAMINFRKYSYQIILLKIDLMFIILLIVVYSKLKQDKDLISNIGEADICFLWSIKQ